ncbi:MAG: bifunctional homocysteine S-methyltransferase/methylenetetrahydrofolate reductase [Kiritimatiellae bacterium]|nr:bifunctional homocysteine S-methyltransferase/methylenetetrahydrofolate reductase [Kiritimatiellia bacterium]
MSKGRTWLDRLQSEFLAGCGAHDSRLYETGGNNTGDPEILNLTHPDLVRRIYEEYADAGAALMATNTTAANTVCLRRCGLESKLREINLAGARLAMESAGNHACVAGSVGPLGLTIEEDWDLDTLAGAYRDQISALLEGGVHLIQLEFFTNLEELLFALELAKSLGGRDVPVIAQMTFLDGARVESGEEAAQVARALAAAGADVIGANCGRSISTTVHAAEALLGGAGATPVSAYLNAGYPETSEGRLVYMASPAYMAEAAMKLAKAGVRLLGGCCGATPEVIRAMALSLGTIRPKQQAAIPKAVVSAGPARAGVQEIDLTKYKQGGFLDGLRDDSIPIIAEIDPPGHLQVRSILDDARWVAEAGADAISLADNPLASLKMGNVAVAAMLQNECGVKTICHVTCRDRNALGLQSELMGAHALGIRGILAITGDPLGRSVGSGRAVFEFNSFTLVRLLAGLNRGASHSGSDLKGESDFSIGVAFNSAARNLNGEAQRLGKKIAEGAQFVMTQPVFDAEQAGRVLELTRANGIRVFLGFFPLISARTALYLHNEVPGMRIPEPILQRLASLPAKEDQEKAGLEMTQRLLAGLADQLDGIYLISPHNRARVLAPLVRMIRAWPKRMQNKMPG